MAKWKDGEPLIYFIAATLGSFVLAPSIGLGLTLLC
jgi:hypothetical protein